jgi:hypothetical protein
LNVIQAQADRDEGREGSAYCITEFALSCSDLSCFVLSCFALSCFALNSSSDGFLVFPAGQPQLVFLKYARALGAAEAVSSKRNDGNKVTALGDREPVKPEAIAHTRIPVPA